MNNTITITQARHAWPERAGFIINRPKGLRVYTFLHFFGSVGLLVKGKVITTLPDTCIIYSTDTPQWFHSPGILQHDWMHMTGDVPGALAAAGLEPDTPYTAGNAKFITAITREIEFEVLTQPASYKALTDLKFQELLFKLARTREDHSASVSLKTATVSQLCLVRSQVFSTLERAWTVADMAALAYISPSRFHAVYRQLFGISPMDDLIRARIDTAKIRLTSGEESVRALADDLGYRNVTHFCRQFKQMTGLTPAQFREALER